MTTEAIRKGRPFAERQTPNQLREYRIRANMTQEQLAERIGVKQENISKAETTGKGLGNENWFRLSHLFDVDPRILRGWKPPEPETSASPTV